MALFERTFTVSDYDLAATLNSGQAFRWRRSGDSWEGVVGHRWVRLRPVDQGIQASAIEDPTDWSWLPNYLQLDIDLGSVVASFPDDKCLQEAVKACCGLRLLRQDIWECLASFILSSTKQIIQIRQVIDRLCQRFGEPVLVPQGCAPQFSFPAASRLMELEEADLRACGMGFRAPYLLGSARMVAHGEIRLDGLPDLTLEMARTDLMKLPGVGRKIADCVLLFAVGHLAAFPIDVWILKTLRRLYFAGRAVPLKRLIPFTESHFGPFAGYAQQYLFHHARSGAGKVAD